MNNRHTILFCTLVILVINYIVTITILQRLPTNGIEAEVLPYVSSFIKYGTNIVGNSFVMPQIDIGIGGARYMLADSYNSRYITIGLCNPHIKPINVVLDKIYWQDATDMEREQLVFHELGHCILKRMKHKNDEYKGIPLSIMGEYAMEPDVYVKYRNEYILELFTEMDLSQIFKLK